MRGMFGLANEDEHHFSALKKINHDYLESLTDEQKDKWLEVL